MKRTLLICSSLTILASCSYWDNLISRDAINPELPGIPTQINCNPEPTLIYSKAGDLIDTVIPVLHPSCEGQVLGETVELAGPWWSVFGPPTRSALLSPNESRDKDEDVTPVSVVTDTPNETVVPDTPTEPVEPDTPTEPDTPVEPEPDDGCNGALSCEPDSKTEPEKYKKWRIEAKENEAKENEAG